VPEEVCSERGWLYTVQVSGSAEQTALQETSRKAREQLESAIDEYAVRQLENDAAAERRGGQPETQQAAAVSMTEITAQALGGTRDRMTVRRATTAKDPARQIAGQLGLRGELALGAFCLAAVDP
jgi:hypothetical protein